MYDVISAPDPDAWFTHGFTYSGHPVACAAGLKNIEIMEREDICGHVRKVGPYLEKRLRDLYGLPIVGDVRGRNFMMCTENVADKRDQGRVRRGRRHRQAHLQLLRGTRPDRAAARSISTSCRRRSS